MTGLGVAVTVYLVITQSAVKTIPLQIYKYPHPSTSIKMSRYIQVEEEVSRMFINKFKSALIRLIKFYRTMKPEVKLATCFTRYAGIVQERSYQCGLGECEGRAMTKEEEDDATVQKLLREMVHATMLFMSDLTPQPVSMMMRMAMGMWQTTRDMYKAIRQDEMGNCSLDYMSKRFWWWVGI